MGESLHYMLGRLSEQSKLFSNLGGEEKSLEFNNNTK